MVWKPAQECQGATVNSLVMNVNSFIIWSLAEKFGARGMVTVDECWKTLYPGLRRYY